MCQLGRLRQIQMKRRVSLLILWRVCTAVGHFLSVFFRPTINTKRLNSVHTGTDCEVDEKLLNLRNNMLNLSVINEVIEAQMVRGVGGR